LQAAFDGAHDWSWRNGSGGEMTKMLSMEGEYSGIKRVL
jgi:hypothetical protein